MRFTIRFPFQLVAAAVLALLPAQAVRAQQAPRRIEVTAKRFEFSPMEITLKKNEPVILVLTSADVAHGIRFRELGIEGKTRKGQAAEIAFTPTKTGTFTGHCSVFCGSGHGAMTLVLHVTD